MKIAHLTTVDMSLRFLVLPQLRSVVDSGGEAIGISAPGPWVEEIKAAGIRHVPLSSSTRGIDWLADLQAMRELWRALRRERPDILHTHNPKPGLYGRILGRLARVPVVVNTVHGFYATPDDPWVKRLAVYALEAVASRFSDAELFQSPEDLALARRLRIVPPRKAVLLGNGVDLERFDPSRFSEADRASMRSELGIASDDVVVGIVGRLVEEKGYLELFSAARTWPDTVRLVVVGPDDPTKPDTLPREAVERGRTDGVLFLGMRDDVDRLYSAFDLFVLPSHREGFPRSAMEAAAMGLPVIATDIRGCRQVVDDGATGILFPVRDVARLCQAVLDLASDPERRAVMGTAARAKAEAEFDERRVVRIVHDVHRQCWEAQGKSWALESVRAGGTLAIRPAHLHEAGAIATLHAAGISTGFLSALGPGFLTELYESMISSEGCAVFVAVDRGGHVAGFVGGTASTSSFYREFIRSPRAVRAGLATAPRLLRPSTLRRAVETLKYGAPESEDESADAELLSMAVAPSARGLGLGKRLGEELISWFESRGSASARVVVGADNDPALALYRSLGFGDDREIEVHPGEQSLVLTWRG